MDSPRRSFARGRLLLLAGLVVAVALPLGSLAAEKSSSQEKVVAANSVDLRPEFKRLGLDVRSQGDRNTCSVFTMAGALEFALAKRGKTEPLSVEFLNWASNDAARRTEDGSYFSDLWKGFRAYGACVEADMPYQSEYNVSLRPSADARARAESLRDAGLHMHWIKRWNPSFGASSQQLKQIKRVLREGWPVCGGFLWPKKGQQQWTEGVLNVRPRHQMRDGHSVLLVGYRDDPSQPGGGMFLINNSDKGPANEALSYEYIRAYMNDAVWVNYTPDKKLPAELKEVRPKPWWLE